MFHLKKSRVGTCCIVVFLSLLCVAQTRSNSRPISNAGAQSFSLKKVSSSGSTRFTEADIIKASGLKIGDTVTADDLKQAADRLGQSRSEERRVGKECRSRWS